MRAIGFEEFNFYAVVRPLRIAKEQTHVGSHDFLDQLPFIQSPFAGSRTVGYFCNLLIERLDFLLDLLFCGLLLRCADQRVLLFDVVKDSQHRVVVPLADRIIFVVVASRATQGQTQKDFRSCGNNIIQFVVTVFFQDLVADGRPVPTKPGGYQGFEAV